MQRPILGSPWFPALALGCAVGMCILTAIDAVRSLTDEKNAIELHTKQAGQIHALQEEIAKMKAAPLPRQEHPVFVFCPELHEPVRGDGLSFVDDEDDEP